MEQGQRVLCTIRLSLRRRPRGARRSASRATRSSVPVRVRVPVRVCLSSHGMLCAHVWELHTTRPLPSNATLPPLLANVTSERRNGPSCVVAPTSTRDIAACSRSTNTHRCTPRTSGAATIAIAPYPVHTARVGDSYRMYECCVCWNTLRTSDYQQMIQ